MWYSDRLHYYPSKEYVSSTWFGSDKSSLEKQVKLCTKSLDRCCIHLDARDARAFGVCRIPLSSDGTLGTPRYDVNLVSINPFRPASTENAFFAEGKTAYSPLQPFFWSPSNTPPLPAIENLTTFLSPNYANRISQSGGECCMTKDCLDKMSI